MLFCLGEGRYKSEGEGYQKNNRIFNVDVTSEELSKAKSSLPTIKLPVTKWIEKADMTDTEKENNSVYKQIGGYLKTMSYEEAWAEVWENLSKSDKQKFLDLPHFSQEIFKKITGIEVEKENSKKQELIDKAEALKAKANELLEKAEEL